MSFGQTRMHTTHTLNEYLLSFRLPVGIAKEEWEWEIRKYNVETYATKANQFNELGMQELCDHNNLSLSHIFWNYLIIDSCLCLLDPNNNTENVFFNWIQFITIIKHILKAVRRLQVVYIPKKKKRNWKELKEIHVRLSTRNVTRWRWHLSVTIRFSWTMRREVGFMRFEKKCFFFLVLPIVLCWCR